MGFTVVTREEYKRLERYGYAGPRENLDAETREWWPAPYWVRQDTREGPGLLPVTVS